MLGRMVDDPAGLPPFRRRDASGLGLAERDVRRLVAAGELRVLRHGVLVGRRRLALSADDRQRHALAAAAALAALDRQAAVSHESAACLHGLTVLGHAPSVVRLTRPGGSCRRMPGTTLRVCGLPEQHVTEVDGVRVTTLARTVVDLARASSRRASVVIADSARRAGCSGAELESVLRFCWTWPGIDRAAWVVHFADSRAEGALESLSRLVFHEHGLPQPDLQVRLGESDLVGRVDFYWRAHGVVGEADGLLKYADDPDALRREKLRQERLEDAGFVVVRWGWDDIWNRPEETVARILRAFGRARARS